MNETTEEIRTADGQDLKDMLTELLAYYFKTAREADRDAEDRTEIYNIGKADGAVEALEVVFMNLYGGKAAFYNWLRNIGETEEGADEIVEGIFPERSTE